MLTCERAYKYFDNDSKMFMEMLGSWISKKITYWVKTVYYKKRKQYDMVTKSARFTYINTLSFVLFIKLKA